MDIFSSTLNQTMFLFSLIAIGYILAKCKIIPEAASEVLAKLENMVFVPGLILSTFIENFTVERISSAWKLLLVSGIILAVMIPAAILISKCFAKDKYTQNIYTYGLIFSNFGFMGNAVVSALFPDIFFEYIIFVLPLWIMIYLWAVPCLLIADSGKQSIRQRLKAFVNPMFIAMLAGMIIGLSGLKLPSFINSVVSVSGSCMSPIAMLLTGITVSQIDVRKTFSDLKIYAVSIIRLIIIPLAFIGISKFVPFENTVFICALCSLAMPLGLNTIVIPSAYGKDTSTAAGMAVISHLLSCITLPFIFSLI